VISRSFSTALERLAQYNAYLEKLGGRLSHELRTPVTVVRSSLENLKMAALPEEARWATLLSACSTDGDLACVLRALEARGGSPADLEAAEAAGVLEMGGDRVLITHPLLRAVVVELAGGRERRAAHRLLGEALGDEEGGERWAWHRAQGAIGPDEPAATALAAFAARAADRGAAAAAAAGFDRAAGFLADHDVDLRVFVLLGAPYVAPEESVEWTVRTAEYAARRGATAIALIPVRGGNGELERLESLGHFAPPSLAQLEAALDGCLGLAPVAVAADLWDLDRLPACAECRPRRIERLRRLNVTGGPEPRVVCPACGALSAA